MSWVIYKGLESINSVQVWEELVAAVKWDSLKKKLKN